MTYSYKTWLCTNLQTISVLGLHLVLDIDQNCKENECKLFNTVEPRYNEVGYNKILL